MTTEARVSPMTVAFNWVVPLIMNHQSGNTNDNVSLSEVIIGSSRDYKIGVERSNED